MIFRETVKELIETTQKVRANFRKAIRSTLDEGIIGKVSDLIDTWKTLPPEQKEAMFFLPLHTSISSLILIKLWQEGLKPIELISAKPGLAVAGVVASGIYATALSKILERITE